MKQCNACDRHIFGPESVCPFCGADQPTTAARPRGLAMASMAFAMTVGLTACGPNAGADTTESSGSDPSSESGQPTTSNPTSTTTVATSTTTTTDGTMVTSIADSSSSDDSADDFPGSFYAGRPDGSDPGCDLFAQDCPDGEKCMPWANDGGLAWNATRCSPIADDPGQDDEPCTVEGGPTSGIDDCDLGLMCFHVDAKTNTGLCVPLCGNNPADPTCPSMEQQCLISGEGVLALCLDSCQPLTPACAPDFDCHPQGDDFFCIPSEGTGVYGDPCNYTAECTTGHTCVPDTALPGCAPPGCCTPYCDLTAPDDCPDQGSGVSCTPWYEMAPMGYEDVGVCVDDSP